MSYSIEPTGNNTNEPVNSDRLENWHRVGTRRVQKLLKAIDSLGKLADEQRYLYTTEDPRAMFGEIDRAVEEAKRKFARSHNQKLAGDEADRASRFRFPSAK